MSRTRIRALAIFWTFMTMGLHSIPRKQILEIPGGQSFVTSTFMDKVTHAILFGILGFFWSRAFGYRALTTVLVGLGYGMFLEFCQEWLIPGRSGSVADLVADAMGLLIGATIAARGFRPTVDSL